MMGRKSLNPLKLLSAGSLWKIGKTAGGVFLYKMISTQVEKKWVRWTCYGGLALFGVWEPAAIAGMGELWPNWENLEDVTQVPPMPPVEELDS